MGAACGSTDDAKEKQVEKPGTTQVAKEKDAEKAKVSTTVKGPAYRFKDIQDLWFLLAHYAESDEIPNEAAQSFNASELVAFLKMVEDVKDPMKKDAKYILERLSVLLLDKMRDGKTISFRDFWLIVLKILREQYIKPIVVVITDAITKDREATLGITSTREFEASGYDEFVSVQELWNIISSYNVAEQDDLSKQSFNLSELAAFIKIADDVKIKMEENPKAFLNELCASFKGNMSDAQPMAYLEFRAIVLGLLENIHIQPLLGVIADALEKDKKTALEWELKISGYERIPLRSRRASKSKMDILVELWANIADYDVENTKGPRKNQELTTSELVAFLKIAEDVMKDLKPMQKHILGKIMDELRHRMKHNIPIMWRTFRELVLKLLKDSYIMPIVSGISKVMDEDRKKLLGYEIKSTFKSNILEEYTDILELWNSMAGYRGDDGTDVKDQTFYLSDLVAFMKIAEDTNKHLEDDARFMLGWLCKSLVYEMRECASLSYLEFQAIVLSLMEDIHIKPLIDEIAKKIESDRLAILNGDSSKQAEDTLPEIAEGIAEEAAAVENAEPEDKNEEDPAQKEEGQVGKKENVSMNEEGAAEKEEAEVDENGKEEDVGEKEGKEPEIKEGEL